MSQIGSDLPRLLAERYELSERLAMGATTSVWRGHDHVLGRGVAVKLLHPGLAADPLIKARFRDEAVHAARLTHPNIVALYDTGEQEGVAYIVMELVEGSSLRDVLARQGPLPPARAAHLASEIALALEEAHRAGVVHGNLKPANVLFTPDGTLKVADFSITRPGDEHPGQAGGYLAPEQLNGSDVDARTDVYALGACLYEMLTGREPVGPGAPATGQLRTVPLSPRALRAGVPRELDGVVRTAMAADRSLRHPSAQAMASALARSAAAHVDDPPPTIAEPRPESVEAMPVQGFIRHEGSWLGWTLLLVGLAAVLVAVGLGLAKTSPFSVKPKAKPGVTQPNATAAGPIRFVAAQAFDPYGNDHDENGEKARLAIDGDPTSAWTTSGYRHPNLTGNKPGVGLILELDRAQAAHQLKLALLADGGTVELYGANNQIPVEGPATDGSGWTRLAQRPDVLRDTTIGLDGQPYQYYLVWFTLLPQAGTGQNPFKDGITDAYLEP